MTKIDQSINNYNSNANYPAQKKPVREVAERPVFIPDYYGENKTKLERMNEWIEKYPLLNAFYSVGKAFLGEFIEHPLPSILTWLGLGVLMDKYTNSLGGKYETSLLGKAAKFGDNIENSKFLKSKPIQSVKKFFGSAKKQGKNLVKKDPVYMAMKETPSMPERGIVKSEMLNQQQRVTEEFMHIIDRLHLKDEGHVKLEHLALSSKDKQLLKRHFGVKRISAIPQELASNYVLLSRLGLPKEKINGIIGMGQGLSTEMTKKTILDIMELDADKLKKISEDQFGKYSEEVLKATKKVGGRIKIGEGHYKLFGPLTRPFERTISCDQIYNKMHSLGNGAKTGTGRFMSKLIQSVYRGFTFGGGKLGVLIFIAPATVVAAMNVRKAENNQKVATGVSSFVNSISWVFTFPMALKIMHFLGGAQYAGMGRNKIEQRNNVAKSRKIINDFNEANKRGDFKTKAQYTKAKNIAKRKLDKLYNPQGQKLNIFTKGVKKLARLMTIDLGRFDVYNTGNKITTKLSKLRNFPRNAFGVPLRIGIWAGLSMGVLDTIINKGVKFIFGESYNYTKEEEVKEAKKEEKKFLKEDLQERLYETQRQKMKKKTPKQAVQRTPQLNSVAHKGQAQTCVSPQTELRRSTVDTYTYIPSQQNIIQASSEASSKNDNYTYIPSQASTLRSKDSENSTRIRTYIPSQAAANITKVWDNSGLEAAIRRSERAERNALKILAGDFEGSK